MTLLQSTLEEINDSEHALFAGAIDRYGEFFHHARGATVYLSLCVTAVDHDRMTFAMLFAHLKKHQFLALISTVRLHRVQAMMNLRQVLEAIAAAAFALENPGLQHFANRDEFGILDPAQQLTKKRYAWLAKNSPKFSQWIKDTKNLINGMSAHANVIMADNIFRVSDEGDRVDAPFFDIADDHYTKADLWLCANVAVTAVQILTEVNKRSRSVGFRDDVDDVVAQFRRKTDTLRQAIEATDRFQSALRIQERRAAGQL